MEAWVADPVGWQFHGGRKIDGRLTAYRRWTGGQHYSCREEEQRWKKID
ncbi:hypothetical protein A2U01_0118869, partial [Trifolium medium]|nr:hypothetical protein [Trifolium medium]